MEQARELAQQFMSGRGEKGPGEHREEEQRSTAATASGGSAAEGGWMGAAQEFVAAQVAGGGQEEAEAGHKAGSGGQPGGGFMGAAQNFLASELGGGRREEAEAGAKGGTASGLMGMAAQAFMGGGSSEGSGAVGAATHEGAGRMDVGLLDKLLTMFQQSEGKQFEGQEHEYDKLAGMAQGALGTPIGRELLKAWVKQRLGI